MKDRSLSRPERREACAATSSVAFFLEDDNHASSSNRQALNRASHGAVRVGLVRRRRLERLDDCGRNGCSSSTRLELAARATGATHVEHDGCSSSSTRARPPARAAREREAARRHGHGNRRLDRKRRHERQPGGMPRDASARWHGVQRPARSFATTRRRSSRASRSIAAART